MVLPPHIYVVEHGKKRKKIVGVVRGAYLKFGPKFSCWVMINGHNSNQLTNVVAIGEDLC
jgi:hypothetical protein